MSSPHDCSINLLTQHFSNSNLSLKKCSQFSTIKIFLLFHVEKCRKSWWEIDDAAPGFLRCSWKMVEERTCFNKRQYWTQKIQRWFIGYYLILFSTNAPTFLFLHSPSLLPLSFNTFHIHREFSSILNFLISFLSLNLPFHSFQLYNERYLSLPFVSFVCFFPLSSVYFTYQWKKM